MTNEREAQIQILSAAVESDPSSADIDQLMQVFGMSWHHRDRLLAVLRAGYWRKAKQPFVSVKSSVFASDVDENSDALGDPDVAEAAMEHDRTLFGRRHAGFTPNFTYEDCAVGFYEDDDGQPSAPKGIERVRSDLTVSRPIDPTGEWSLDDRRHMNWKQVGERMGLDAFEISVLEYKAQGISFRAAARIHRDKVAQDALKAAWARVDRLMNSGALQNALLRD